MSDFHEIRFPLDVSLGGGGGPERRTEIVTLGSNREQRNARWAHSRRRYEAGYGVKTLAQLAQVIAFFEERRGRLYGFRWRDRAWGVQFHPEFATHHMRGYVHARAEHLRSEGHCPGTIARNVTAAPQARKLLRRFVRHARGLHAR